MRFPLVIAAGLLLAACAPGHGQVADDRYVKVYGMIEEADKLKASGDGRAAVTRYLEAQVELKSLQQSFPEWNTKLVAFRLDYVSTQLSGLTEKHPVTAAKAGPAAESMTPTAELKALEDEIGRLSSQNALLEAKLREALKVQPAAIDPRELTKAEDRIKHLQKERDLLKVTIEQSSAKAARGNEEETKQNLVTQSAVANLLQKQNEDLQNQITELTARLKSSALPGASAREALALKENIAALEASNRVMKEEQVEMEKRLKEFVRQYGSATLRRQGELERQLAEARAATETAQKERDALIEKLNAVTRQLNQRDQTPSTAATRELEGQLESIRARLQIFEARNVPYTAAELALFKQAPIKVAATQTNLVPATNGLSSTGAVPVPPETRALINDAQRAIDGNRFDEAEQRFRQILRQDDKNVFIMAKLAAVQMDQDKLSEAEETLKQALALAPQDPVALYFLGGLKLRQERYDEALEALSLSAKIDPDKAQTHYFLGQTLIQKGSRGPAETALRKALQLKPAWGDAHYLLAVLYAQEPKFKELARYHYNQALSGGASRNYQFEQFMAQSGKP